MALRSRACAWAGRPCASATSSCHGQADAMAILIRRTLTRTNAPSFSSFSRIVPQGGVGELRVREPDAAQAAQQDVGHGRKPQARVYAGDFMCPFRVNIGRLPSINKL